MKIYIEADSIANQTMSGIGHTTLEIIKTLDRASQKSDIKVTIIIPPGKKKFVARYGFKNVKVRTLPISQKYVNYLLTRMPIPVPADLWFGRGVYIFPNYKNWYVPFSKSLTFVHDVAFKIYPDTINPRNLTYLESNFKRWLRRTTRVITITHASAADFGKYFPEYKSKVDVIPLGVDRIVFSHQADSKVQEALNRNNLPKDYFLYVGNIEPRKNIYNLLRAYEQYCKLSKHPIALVLVGADGWQNDDILETINSLQQSGHQIIRPNTYVKDEDLPALYSGAKALVLVSVHEGFGLSAMQAEACGTRVIASDIAPLRELLRKDYTSFVSPLKPEKIAVELLAHERLANRTSKALETEDSHTWEKTVSKILDIAIIN